MKWIIVCAVLAVTLFAIGTAGQSQTKSGMDGKAGMQDKKCGCGGMADHTLITPSDLEWKDGPASLPPGAKLAVLEGDPGKEGPFTIRVKVPANYKVPPHTHPAIEHVTVIEGSLQMGLGEKWDDAAMTNLPTGSFAVMQTGTKHFAGSKAGATIQLHGMGPWGINYLNPADDPRNSSKD